MLGLPPDRRVGKDDGRWDLVIWPDNNIRLIEGATLQTYPAQSACPEATPIVVSPPSALAPKTCDMQNSFDELYRCSADKPQKSSQVHALAIWSVTHSQNPMEDATKSTPPPLSALRPPIHPPCLILTHPPPPSPSTPPSPHPLHPLPPRPPVFPPALPTHESQLLAKHVHPRRNRKGDVAAAKPEYLFTIAATVANS